MAVSSSTPNAMDAAARSCGLVLLFIPQEPHAQNFKYPSENAHHIFHHFTESQHVGTENDSASESLPPLVYQA